MIAVLILTSLSIILHEFLYANLIFLAARNYFSFARLKLDDIILIAVMLALGQYIFELV
jgi:hypothetical protein